jgi:hypothetical protein
MEGGVMKGHVARKGNRFYAVIYEGTDPITGKERRSWHPAGCERSDAERLAARLVRERDGANDEARSLTLGAFLTSRWLPGKKIVLAASTYTGYCRNVDNHVVPTLGRIALRRLRADHLEAFYNGLLDPHDGRAGLAPKSKQLFRPTITMVGPMRQGSSPAPRVSWATARLPNAFSSMTRGE